MNYKDQLLDPRWQRKRLEILERDEFTCQVCFDKDTTLHIHHLKYSNGHAWDIENVYLATVCKHCHSIIEFNKGNVFNIKNALKRNLSDGGVLICVTYVDEDSDVCVDFYNYKNECISHYLSVSKSTIDIISQADKSLVLQEFEIIKTKEIYGK